jgi:transcriptional regulator with XRE-family HTH domain
MGKLLGQYIKEKRKALRLSALALAQRSDISKSYLDYIECGMREPQADILAKIATGLGGGQEIFGALTEKQNTDRLDSAQSKLRAKQAEGQNSGEVRSAARDGSAGFQIEEQALAMVLAAFNDVNNPAKFAELIPDPNLRAILVAGAHLSAEDLEKLKKTAEVLFPNAFNK